MKKIMLFFLLLISSGSLYAAGGSNFPLDKAPVDLEDNASLQRGAMLFTNYCLGCHSLKYHRYERSAVDLAIPAELYEQHLIFSDHKIGQLMTIAMDPKDGAQWFGAAPPDLTLVSRLRGPDWLYTYLRNFYIDPARPWGVNNLLFKDVGMPHVLIELQGTAEKVCAPARVYAENGGVKRDPLTGKDILEEQCGILKVKEGTGSMSAEEYDQAVGDLVNFLAYVGEPGALKRKELGTYVLLFLAIFFVFAYLLKREYWKDVK